MVYLHLPPKSLSHCEVSHVYFLAFPIYNEVPSNWNQNFLPQITIKTSSYLPSFNWLCILHTFCKFWDTHKRFLFCYTFKNFLFFFKLPFHCTNFFGCKKTALTTTEKSYKTTFCNLFQFCMLIQQRNIIFSPPGLFVIVLLPVCFILTGRLGSVVFGLL